MFTNRSVLDLLEQDCQMSPDIFLRNWKERRDIVPDELSEEFNHILMEQEKNRQRTTKKRKQSPIRQSEIVLMHVIDRDNGLRD